MFFRNRSPRGASGVLRPPKPPPSASRWLAVGHRRVDTKKRFQTQTELTGDPRTCQRTLIKVIKVGRALPRLPIFRHTRIAWDANSCARNSRVRDGALAPSAPRSSGAIVRTCPYQGSFPTPTAARQRPGVRRPSGALAMLPIRMMHAFISVSTAPQKVWATVCR